MAYTETTELLLKKAVPGTNQPFETAEINNNWDKVDDAVVALIAVDAATAGDVASLSTQITDVISGDTPITITTIDGGAA